MVPSVCFLSQFGRRTIQKKFRRRFRLPYQSFLEFMEDARANNWFPWSTRPDATKKDPLPLELLILGAFRYIGRGFTFDDLEEATAISEETHRIFFHDFIAVGSTILFEKYVSTPTTKEELKQHIGEFEMAGMPGTPASSDATSIVHEACAYRLRRMHKGGKFKHPSKSVRYLATAKGPLSMKKKNPGGR